MKAWQLGTIVLVFSLVPPFFGNQGRAQTVDFDKLDGRPGLLTQKAAQEELKLSAEQVVKVTDIYNDFREKLRPLMLDLEEKYNKLSVDERKAKVDEERNALRMAQQPVLDEMNSKLRKVLSPVQMKRYKQLSLRQGLPRVWSHPDVQSLLGLDGEQKAKIRGFLEDNRVRLGRFIEIIRKVADRKVASEQMAILVKESQEQVTRNVLAILDESQKAVWKEMLGEPF